MEDFKPRHKQIFYVNDFPYTVVSIVLVRLDMAGLRQFGSVWF